MCCDGSCFKMHPTSPRAEPLLCAWAITTDNEKALLGLAPGSSESYDAWLDFFRDPKERGLKPPLLGITDGAPGMLRAFEEVLDQSLRQRCLVHKSRNLVAKVPKEAESEVKGAFWSIFDGIEADPGEAAIVEARARACDFQRTYGKLYPSAVECVMKDLPELTVHLRFPRQHWERIRHTNLLERTFGESRRRVKVIGRLPGERSCISLVWAVLDRASKGWRGLTQTPAGIRLLQNLRAQLLNPPDMEEVMEEIQETVTTAA